MLRNTFGCPSCFCLVLGVILYQCVWNFVSLNQNRNDHLLDQCANYFREVSFGSVNRVACQCICSV